uniref:Uncharacterized protein n=1 Tax=Arundo donax TaxID=35708 RepID=A0A0A8YDN7_ARUDO
MPTSCTGLSVDLLTDRERMSDCAMGVSCSDTREGKCFSSEP